MLRLRGVRSRASSWPRRLALRLRGVTIHRSVLVGRGVEIVGRGSRITIGAGTVLERNCRLTVSMAPHAADARLRIGQRVLVGVGTQLTCHQDLNIGDDVLIAAGCYITEANHGTAAGAVIRDQPQVYAAVTLVSGCWLGAHTVVAPGVSIGEGAVVGAGSVVTRDVDAHAVVAGVPARFIKFRV